MKKLMLLLFAGFWASCTGIGDNHINGTLRIFPRAGYTDLELTDGPTGQSYNIPAGRYRIDFAYGLLGFKEPEVTIYDASQRLVGELHIPRKSFHGDGTFEYYGFVTGNKNAFHILGGKKKTVLGRELSSRLHADCTYTITVACTIEVPDVDAKGRFKGMKQVASTCDKTVNGHRDELWAHEQYQYAYRILFDGYDLGNVADFTGDGSLLQENSRLSADQCE